MPSVVIKPDRDRDEYVVWSTVTDCPHGYGNREEMTELLRSGIRRGDVQDRTNPEAVLDRVDRNGSSALGGWSEGLWGDDCWIYMQAGYLRRQDLWQAAVLLCDGRERDVLDLLEPLEDDGDFSGVRHLGRVKAETVNEPAAGGRRAEVHIGTADAAVGAVKAVVESWNR